VGHRGKRIRVSRHQPDLNPILRSLTTSCSECGVVDGDAHWPSCSRKPHLPLSDSIGGSDIGAAIAECRRRGWAVAYVQSEGFRPCDPDDHDAYVDIDRYVFWRTHGDSALYGDDGRPSESSA